jgi:hypothetical protein
MKTYARIQQGLVAEMLKTDGDITAMFNPALDWVDVSSEPSVADGWIFDGKSFTPPPASPTVAPTPTIAELQAQLTILSAQLEVLSNKG